MRLKMMGTIDVADNEEVSFFGFPRDARSLMIVPAVKAAARISRTSLVVLEFGVNQAVSFTPSRCLDQATVIRRRDYRRFRKRGAQKADNGRGLQGTHRRLEIGVAAGTVFGLSVMLSQVS